MAQEKLNRDNDQQELEVFFDLDGTLLDVSVRNYRVYSELVTEAGGTPLDKDIYWNLKRKKAKWPELLPKSRLSPAIEKEFLDKFIARIEAPEYLELDELFPESQNVLQEVSSRFNCRLVSLRRNESNLRRQLERLAIADYFTKVLSGHSESDGYDKKIALIKGELGADRGIIIGDTEADIVTGKTLGMIAVALTSGIRDAQFLNALEPDYIIDGIGQLTSLPMFVQK